MSQREGGTEIAWTTISTSLVIPATPFTSLAFVWMHSTGGWYYVLFKAFSLPSGDMCVAVAWLIGCLLCLLTLRDPAREGNLRNFYHGWIPLELICVLYETQGTERVSKQTRKLKQIFYRTCKLPHCRTTSYLEVVLPSYASACLLSSSKNIVIKCMHILVRNVNLVCFASLLSICVPLNSCLEAGQRNDQAKRFSEE